MSSGSRIACSAKHYFAIVDEVDSILIDEAYTADHFGPSEESTDKYYKVNASSRS